MNEAIAYIAKCKQLDPDDLTIPSQRRYASYFKNMLDGVRPSQTPLMLKRIIMSEAPRVSSSSLVISLSNNILASTKIFCFFHHCSSSKRVLRKRICKLSRVLMEIQNLTMTN